MTFKRALTLLLIGLILGLILGTAGAYWRRMQRQTAGPAVPTATPEAVLTLRCTGGATPTVHVSWDPRLTSVVGNMERSADGTNWTGVFVNKNIPVPAGYDDTTVQSDTQYQYRFRIKSDAPYISAAVTTDKAACQ